MTNPIRVYELSRAATGFSILASEEDFPELAAKLLSEDVSEDNEVRFMVKIFLMEKADYEAMENL